MSICLQEISQGKFLTPPALALPGKPFILSKGAPYMFGKKYCGNNALDEKYVQYVCHGYRVLGFASRQLVDYSPDIDIEDNLQFNGISVLKDSL